MLVTEETFQEEISWLKEEAPRNMAYISVTEEVSQDERSPLNEEAPRNVSIMLVTLLRSGVSVAL